MFSYKLRDFKTAKPIDNAPIVIQLNTPAMLQSKIDVGFAVLEVVEIGHTLTNTGSENGFTTLYVNKIS